MPGLNTKIAVQVKKVQVKNLIILHIILPNLHQFPKSSFSQLLRGQTDTQTVAGENNTFSAQHSRVRQAESDFSLLSCVAA